MGGGVVQNKGSWWVYGGSFSWVELRMRVGSLRNVKLNRHKVGLVDYRAGIE